jgi:hypothetical protein
MLCLLQLVSDGIGICKCSVCLSLFLIEFSSANALVCFRFFSHRICICKRSVCILRMGLGSP